MLIKTVSVIIILLLLSNFLSEFTLSNEINKEEGRRWFSEGQTALVLGNYDEAIEFFENVFEVDPGFIDIHRFLGDVYLKKGDLGKAKDEYKQVIKVKNPNNLPAHVGIGNIYFQEGKLEQAMSEYKQGLVLTLITHLHTQDLVMFI